MNKVVIIGRLVRDPELRFSPSGVAVCNMTLAVDRRFKKDGQPSADFLNVVVFNKQAEHCANFLSKGKMAGVSGSIQNDSYEKDGEKKYITKIVADEVQFLSPRGDRADEIGTGVDPEDDLPF